MMNIFAIALITINVWTSIVPCCHGGTCGPVHHEGHMVDEEQAAMHCSESGCSQKEQQACSDAPTVTNDCDCGKHREIRPNTFLTKTESCVLQPPIVFGPVSRPAGKRVCLTLEFTGARFIDLASARYAPRLSLLGRYLIWIPHPGVKILPAWVPANVSTLVQVLPSQTQFNCKGTCSGLKA